MEPRGIDDRPIAAIDIGTNSFHMVVARPVRGSTNDDFPRFEVIAREKESVRLGSGSGDMKRLDPDAIDRGLAALVRLGRVAAIHDADVYAVATSAVREADNAEEFIERARAEAGIVVDVIAGVEEARLIHLGVLQAVPVFDRQVVLIDIGGGSTEILVGLRGETVVAGSLKLGAIRLTRRFFRDETIHPGAVEACRRHVRSALAPMVRDVARVGFEVAVASSGTAETVASIVNARAGRPTPRTFNNFAITAAEVAEVVAQLAEARTIEERRRIPGMDAARADIILGGAIVLEQAVARLGIESLVISDHALREGVLLDALSRRNGATLHHLRDLRRRSVLHLAREMDEDPEHSARTAGFALELFDRTRTLHGCDDGARELLEAAALLANVGFFISHSEHHKHSYYVIRHSDRLSGFTDHEIELIAMVARYHRKSAPKAKHAEFAALRPEDQQLIRTLSGLLRVAIALDRAHADNVAGIDCDLGETEVRLTVLARAGRDIALEIETAEDRKALLEDVLDRTIVLVASESTASP